ncbi:hypothetical protein JXB37_04400 [candidate division WOR-3 bacterium]|nr:hypothetical protein [candidate division WOR-3 bacterium]
MRGRKKGSEEQAVKKNAPSSKKLRKGVRLAKEAVGEKGREVGKGVARGYAGVKSALGDAAVAVAGKMEKAGKAAKKSAATAKRKNKVRKEER